MKQNNLGSLTFVRDIDYVENGCELFFDYEANIKTDTDIVTCVGLAKTLCETLGDAATQIFAHSKVNAGGFDEQDFRERLKLNVCRFYVKEIMSSVEDSLEYPIKSYALTCKVNLTKLGYSSGYDIHFHSISLTLSSRPNLPPLTGKLPTFHVYTH